MSAWRPLLRIRNAQHRPYSAAAASTSPAKQFRGCGAEASGRESEFVQKESAISRQQTLRCSLQGECVEDRKKHATCSNREQLLGDFRVANSMFLNCPSFPHMRVCTALDWVLLPEVGLHGKGALTVGFGRQLGKKCEIKNAPPHATEVFPSNILQYPPLPNSIGQIILHSQMVLAAHVVRIPAICVDKVQV